jgi:hypothetical protein
LFFMRRRSSDESGRAGPQAEGGAARLEARAAKHRNARLATAAGL